MQASRFLLSICIPTFNRAALLQVALESIAAQPVFTATDDIEVVIGDNHSSDDTAAVAEAFRQRFPGKVTVIRHETNIGAGKNFYALFKAARGQFLKLFNDYLVFLPGSLEPIVNVVRAAQQLKPTLFMLNGNRPSGRELDTMGTLEEFIRTVSFFSTWIGSFGVWRDQLPSEQEYLSEEPSLLPQTHVLFKMVCAGRGVIVLQGRYFGAQNAGRKGGYNFAEVFGKNYLALLKKYVATAQITQQTFEAEKRDVLLRHILPYYLDGSNGFDKTRFFEHLADYRDEPYFHEAIARVLPQIWRMSNPHNDTTLARVSSTVTLAGVCVGRKTFGALSILDSGNEKGRLSIGSFVSIGEDVKFILGGKRVFGSLSTYPFKEIPHGTSGAEAPGQITVCDDVRIGYGALVLAGVSIGQGAVIEAGSVVTHDVPPYAVAAGNPAKVVGYRFDQDVIDKLSAFDFSRLDDQTIAGSLELLSTRVGADNVDRILSLLGQQAVGEQVIAET